MRFWVYIDNNNCLAALARCDSNKGVIVVLVACFWKLVQRFDIGAWFPRVHSDINPADLPTRGKEIPFRPNSRDRPSPFGRCLPDVGRN